MAWVGVGTLVGGVAGALIGERIDYGLLTGALVGGIAGALLGFVVNLTRGIRAAQKASA